MLRFLCYGLCSGSTSGSHARMQLVYPAPHLEADQLPSLSGSCFTCSAWRHIKTFLLILPDPHVLLVRPPSTTTSHHEVLGTNYCYHSVWNHHIVDDYGICAWQRSGYRGSGGKENQIWWRLRRCRWLVFFVVATQNEVLLLTWIDCKPLRFPRRRLRLPRLLLLRTWLESQLAQQLLSLQIGRAHV